VRCAFRNQARGFVLLHHSLYFGCIYIVPDVNVISNMGECTGLISFHFRTDLTTDYKTCLQIERLYKVSCLVYRGK